jgi:dsDNA-specific endonuclease/ATPase MutS2
MTSIQLPTHENIRDAYAQGEEAVIQLIAGLIQIVERQAEATRELEEAVQRLQDQLAKNSHNWLGPLAGQDGHLRVQFH